LDTTSHYDHASAVDLATDAATAIANTVEAVAALATDLGRDDFAQRLAAASARVRRPATIVCVVGEFKQGKSSLVNALLGRAICPVDDDIATSAITLIRYGPEPRVEVRRRVDDGVVVETVQPRELTEWVSERGNPDNVKNVERVDISVPHPLLANGLAIVDTPGMGGLGAGHAAATLAFLPFADGLIFVTDASSELSAPEAEFLDRAYELCPQVLFALTKTDLYPAWRRIATIDNDRRAAHVGHQGVLPVSATLFGTDLEPGDESLAETSGIPSFLGTLDSAVVTPAKALAAVRARAEATGVLAQLDQQVRLELELLCDPAGAEALEARLADATARLDLLRGPGARWNLLVADRVSDLSNSSSFEFRKSMRQVSRDMEEAIELLKSPEEWEQLARRLQTDVATVVTTLFVGIEQEHQAVREAVIELIGDESVGLAPRLGLRDGIDVSSMWTDKGIDPDSKHHGGQQLGSALVGLRGAQSGIIMFGMMGRFLPAGAAALMMSNPVTVGIGAVFAGMQLADAHKRKIAMRRQQARSNVRQFLDEVQFAIGNELSGLLRDVQRGIRDEFTERIAELGRTYSEAAQSAQWAAREHGAAAPARIVALQRTVARVDDARVLLAQSSTP